MVFTAPETQAFIAEKWLTLINLIFNKQSIHISMTLKKFV